MNRWQKVQLAYRNKKLEEDLASTSAFSSIPEVLSAEAFINIKNAAANEAYGAFNIKDFGNHSEIYSHNFMIKDAIENVLKSRGIKINQC